MIAKKVGAAVAVAAETAESGGRLYAKLMTKRGIIDELLVRHPGITYRDSETLVSALFEALTRELASGHRIELRGFGSFAVKLRRPRQARNPRTGAAVEVAARRTPFFRAGKELRVKLNGPATGESRSSV